LKIGDDMVMPGRVVPNAGQLSRRPGRARAAILIVMAAVMLTGCAGGVTTPATNVTDTGARLTGLVFDPFDATITYWFQYGQTTAYGSETTHRPLTISDRNNHPVTEDVSGLSPSTTYHYQVCAKDPNPHGQDPGNQVVCGGDSTFKTTDAVITQLAITAAPTLSPGFDPAVTDYVTRCTSTPVAVTVAAPAGTTVAVDGQPAGSGRFTKNVSLAPGKSFAFTTTAGGNPSQSYRVRCLPSDFPAYTYARPGTPSASFYITTPQSVKAPDGSTAARYVAIFDDHGVPVWWVRASGTDAKLLPDGTLTWWTPAAGGTSAPGFEVHALNGSLVRTWRTVGVPTDIHDFQPLSNGNALMMAYPPRPGTQDLSAYSGPATGGTLIDGEIQEVDPNGALVWSWNTNGKVDPSETPTRWRQPYVYGLSTTLPDGRKAYDYVHANSLQQVGNTVVVSFRHLDAVMAINKTTGNIIWKLGGTATPQSLTVVGDPKTEPPIGGQHYARVLSDGTLTIYDNNTNNNDPPRAVRYRIDLFNKTATWVEQVKDPDVSSSPCCGSAQHFSDGSYVMSWGGTPVISEFGPTGARHFKLTFTPSGTGFSYRVDPITGASPTIADLRAGMDAMP
jgi:uncharacterized protein YndB with AHSA1/START domain